MTDRVHPGRTARSRARRACLTACLVAGLAAASLAAAQALVDLPRFALADLRYVGAVRLPGATFGASRLAYAEGPIAIDGARGSLYVVGHAHHQAVAEFLLPPPSGAERLAELPVAAAPVQPFATLLDRAVGGNPQGLDRVGGLALVPGPAGPQLWVNAYVYYDAPGTATHTSLVVRDARDLAHAAVDGPFAFAGGAGHTSGWLSPVPEALQDTLGGPWLTGQSSGVPIVSRASVGPSAFAFDPADADGRSGGSIATARLLDYDLAHPLHPDLDNAGGDNDLWTHLSRAVYGFVVPGTRTYLVLGTSGGHRSGVCYKCVPSDGSDCGGFCARDASDVGPFVWAYDLADLLEVRAGRRAPHDVQPVAYGPLALPFLGPERRLGGAAFDPASGRLYVSAPDADDARGAGEERTPVVMVFEVRPR